MWMLFFAFVFVIVLLCTSYFLRAVSLNLLTGIIAGVGFFVLFSLGSQNYVYLLEDKIEYNPLLGAKVEHEWGDLAKVTHEMDNAKKDQDEKYIFEFTNGYTFEFLVSGIIDGSVKSIIYKKAMTYEVPFEEY